MRIYIIQLSNGCNTPMVTIVYDIYTISCAVLQAFFVKNADFDHAVAIIVRVPNTQSANNPPDSALLGIYCHHHTTASNSNFAGVCPRTMRAQCIRCRFCLALLGSLHCTSNSNLSAACRRWQCVHGAFVVVFALPCSVRYIALQIPIWRTTS